MSLVGTRPPTVANVLTALYQPFWFAGMYAIDDDMILL